MNAQSTRLLSYLAALFSTYNECAGRATLGVRRNWPILLGSIGIYYAFTLAIFIASPFGVIGGFLLGLVQLALLTLYYSWISATFDKERIKIKSLLRFDYSIFFSLMGAAFMLWLGDLLFRDSFRQAQGLQWVPWVYNLVVFLVLNTLPEIIYQHRYDSLPALNAAVQFNKENWVEWYIPLLILLSPLLVTAPLIALAHLAGTFVLLPVMIIPTVLSDGFELDGILLDLLIIIVGNWYMLFRAFLYSDLGSGNFRRRVYQRRVGG